MRMDLPQCNFKNCRNCLDGNCTNIDQYNSCEYMTSKLLLEQYQLRDLWIVDRLPKMIGEYEVLILDAWTRRTFISKLEWDGKKFVIGKDHTVVAWK